ADDFLRSDLRRAAPARAGSFADAGRVQRRRRDTHGSEAPRCAPAARPRPHRAYRFAARFAVRRAGDAGAEPRFGRRRGRRCGARRRRCADRRSDALGTTMRTLLAAMLASIFVFSAEATPLSPQAERAFYSHGYPICLAHAHAVRPAEACTAREIEAQRSA